MVIPASIRSLAACAVLAVLAAPAPARRVYRGRITWYGPGFHGRKTATGDPFDPARSAIASRHIPLGATVRIRTAGGRVAVAVCNDRGGRGIADCTPALARRLRIIRAGHTQATITIIRRPARRSGENHARTKPSHR